MENFLDTQRRLLEIEHAAELKESTLLLSSESSLDLEDRGIVILGLTLDALESGLFGKTVVSLAHHLSRSRKHQGILIPSNSVSCGDIVGIFTSDSFKVEPLMCGVVHAIGNASVKVVLDNDEDAQKLWDFSRFNLAKIGSNVTHVRLMKSVDDLEKSSSALKRYLYEDTDSDLAEGCMQHVPLQSVVCACLNPPQKEAVSNSFCNPLVSVIQGPPGTGKTTTVAALIAEAVMDNPRIRILACAPSNVAVDNLAARVVAAGVKSIVRIGHPTRMDDDMLKHSLDSKIQGSDFSDSCMEIRKEMQAILDSKKGYAGLKELRKELKDRETKSIAQVMSQSNVVFTTCNGAFNLRQKTGLIKQDANFKFDLCVIDESAQGLEMSCWIPILQADRVVLAGDHKQLAATIHSQEAERNGLGVSLFEKCFRRFAKTKGVVNFLSIQYRMNAVIMGWSNGEFYENKLVAHESVADKTLTVKINIHNSPSSDVTLNGVDLSSVIENPFVFCDSTGVEGMAEDVSHTVSRRNAGEAAVVKKYIDLITNKDISSEIAVIAPYSKQVELLRHNCSVDVSTVDSFQGRESDVIVMSLVRSNAEKQVGFLSDFRRLNVAITRAKRQVFIVGDSETICSDPILKSLFDYACDHGLVISAQTFFGDEMAGGEVKRDNREHEKKKRVAKKIAPVKSIPVQEKPKTGEEDTRNVLRKKILKIAQGERFFFPCSLSSAERKHVHAICEQLGFAHGSTGEADERQVWVMKKVARNNPEVKVPEMSQPSSSEDDSESDGKGDIPEGSRPLARRSKFVPLVAPPVPIVVGKTEGICPHANCVMSTRLVSLHCGLCLKDFCVAHANAEVHGCGDAASKAARKAFLSKPVLPKGNGGVSTEQLRKKISAKLDSMQSKRGPKMDMK